MRLLDTFLAKLITKGRLTVIWADGSRGSYGISAPDLPDVTVRFTDRLAPLIVAINPHANTGEMLLEERMIVEQGTIRDFLMLTLANAVWEEGRTLLQTNGLLGAWRKFRATLDRLNWPTRARRNVAHHYDLSDRLYDLFLDKDRQYSCAYFTDPGNDLETAQADKTAHILAKLALEPGQKVLDIAINRITGGEVLGITLSEEQLGISRRRAEQAGVADKVRFELLDYRDVSGQFDRIVSVGMFEHVGPPFYRRFFAQCHELLTPDGVMLLHTIGRLGGPGMTDRFTSRYIFPGGYLPALSEIVGASEQMRLIATDIENLRLHYAYTLDHWYERTLAAEEEIVRLYDARFFRLWQIYLAGAAASFRYGGITVYQLQYARSRHALPITRGYMGEAEAEIRERLRSA
ncbi:MAG: cyclopropane-fatty-acyl-phospholipid synthase family protein [Sphingomonadales bacterium]|nr:cyclopropane-fatty-acyl-phospholipid synthase family protein [Sphingomonadales bacterium]